jgi:Heavy metal associated domain 2
MLSHAYVAHQIPGRMRIKLPEAKGDRGLLQEIQQSISALPGVRFVETNLVTGSVLVHYAPEVENFHDRLAESAQSDGLFTLAPLSPDQDDQATLYESPESLNGPSQLARAITGFVGEISDSIKRETDNLVDLKVLLPLGAGLYSVFRAPREAATPLWLTLAIFSFTSFIVMHQPERPDLDHVIGESNSETEQEIVIADRKRASTSVG